MQGPRAHGVAERRLGEQPGAVVGVLHVGDRDRGVVHAIIDDRVHRHGHAVLRQHLTHIPVGAVNRVFQFYLISRILRDQNGSVKL